MPRVVNASLAVFFLLFLVPLFTHLGGLTTVAQVLLVALAVPFVLLTALCLMSAVRPGSVGRLARRARPSRQEVTGEAGGEQRDLGSTGG